jgi:hypothetical protein
MDAMTDPTTTTSQPPALPHDGWRSRKVILGAGSWLLLVGVATAAMFIGDPPLCSFDQWSGFLQWLTPGVLVPLFGSLAVDKLAAAKVAR